MRWWILPVPIAIGTLLSRVESWSPASETHNRNCNHSPAVQNQKDEITTTGRSRRKIFQHSVAAIVACTSTVSLLPPDPAGAACLQGDLRPLCIGIYKVPPNEVYPFFRTQDQFAEIFPDLRYVPPPEKPVSFESAMVSLRAQRAQADEIRQQVQAGRLEEAGVNVLRIIPLVGTGCRRILNDLAETKIRASVSGSAAGDSSNTSTNTSEATRAIVIEQVQNKMTDVNYYWNECDMVIGQGLRGELGVVTVAQLTILTCLRDATKSLDEFLATAEQLSGQA